MYLFLVYQRGFPAGVNINPCLFSLTPLYGSPQRAPGTGWHQEREKKTSSVHKKSDDGMEIVNRLSQKREKAN